MRARGLFALLSLGACQPGGPSVIPAAPCLTDAPPEGTVVVRWIACSQERLGEARTSDILLANDKLRAVMRHPQHALTVPGVGGGTIIDAAVWGYRDRLHEAIPLVGGGWIEVDEMAIEADGVRLAGFVASLPDRTAEAEGEWREVAWRIAPGESRLQLEGADGLYLHVGEDHTLLGDQLWGDSLGYGHDGVVVEDLGGALRIEGATSLYPVETESLTTELHPDGIRASGSAPEGEYLILFEGDTAIGRARFYGGTFDLRVPASVDGIRVESAGRTPSPTVSPAEDLELEVGPSGALELQLAWPEGDPRPVRASWEAGDGRHGWERLAPEGGVLEVGPGPVVVRLSAGPLLQTVERRVEVEADTTGTLAVTMRPALDPGDTVLAAFAWPGDRSRSWRGADGTALRRAVADGIGYAVVTAEDDVPEAEADATDRAWVRVRDGVVSTSDAGGTIVSWPWSATSRTGGHGAPPVRDLDPERLLLMAGAADRYTAVDAEWLNSVGAPWSLDQLPTFAWLESPGGAGPTSGAWSAWFRWLDHGVPLQPIGPLAWVPVPDAQQFGVIEVERSLERGLATATTGPWLRLEVLGEPTWAGTDDVPVPVRPVEVRWRGASVDHLALVGEGGRVLDTWSPDGSGRATRWIESPGRWLIAVGWTEDGERWAATAPRWTDPPP